jgi:hypothetical protein
MIEAHASVAIGVARIEEPQVLGAKLIARHRAVAVQVSLLRVGEHHHEHWRVRRHRRHRAFAVNDGDFALDMAALVRRPRGFTFNPADDALLDVARAVRFAASMTDDGDAPLAAGPSRLGCGRAVFPLGGAIDADIKVFAHARMIFRRQPPVAVGVEFGEDALGSGRDFRAGEPAVIVGIHVEAMAAAVLNEDAGMVRLRVGGHRHRRERYAKG